MKIVSMENFFKKQLYDDNRITGLESEHITILSNRLFERVPVDPAGDCCYGSSTKPCKLEGPSGPRQNAQ